MRTKDTLASRLLRLRTRAGFTQAELAATADVPLATVQRIEQGAVQSPRLDTLAKLATALRVDAGTLVPPARRGA